MLNLTERKSPRSLRDNIDLGELYDQIDSLRNFVSDLASSLGKGAVRRVDRARDYAAETAREAEDVMKDNFAASLLLALGIGVLAGYFLRRSSE